MKALTTKYELFLYSFFMHLFCVWISKVCAESAAHGWCTSAKGWVTCGSSRTFAIFVAFLLCLKTKKRKASQWTFRVPTLLQYRLGCNEI